MSMVKFNTVMTKECEFEIATDSQDHTLLDDSEVMMSPRSPPAKECFTSSSPFQFNSTVSNETTPRQSCDRYLDFRNGVLRRNGSQIS
ncbi:hypothetical protein Bca4012_001048 [Brassica carinata]